MRILERGIIYSGAQDPALSSCCFPALCQLQDGRIFASFRGGPQKGPYNLGEKGMTCISEDGGTSWGRPVEIFKPPVVNGKPTSLRTLYFLEFEKGHLLAAANAVDATMEQLPYYNEQTEGIKDTYIMVAHSMDGGKTWGPMERVQVQTFYDLPLPLTGAPFLLDDGRIGIQFEVNKPYTCTEYWVHHSAVIYSSDGGYTWGDEVVITDSQSIYYWDQRLSALKNGQVADLFWTFDRNKGDYINIHMCRSTDGGRTFGQPWDTGLSGQPGNVIEGDDGRLLAIYINRDAAPVIKLAESMDGGQSWRDVCTVFELATAAQGKSNAGMNDVWSEMGAFSVGHPFLYRMCDGTLWVYFYSGPSTHRTDFHYVKIEL